MSRNDPDYVTKINFRPKEDRIQKSLYVSHGELPPDADSNTTYFDANGNYTEHEVEAAAKVVSTKHSRDHYIIIDPSGLPYNPVSVYAKKSELFSSEKGFLFRLISKDLFEMYLEFLGTKNLGYYHQVERSVLNG